MSSMLDHAGLAPVQPGVITADRRRDGLLFVQIGRERGATKRMALTEAERGLLVTRLIAAAPGNGDWATDPRISIHERDEGQFFAYLGNDLRGPYESDEDARADLPPTNPARGRWCGCGLFGDCDETHGQAPGPES